jgi:hypothetical protein
MEAVGAAQHIDADRPAHRKGRYIWLCHLDPEDQNDERTGESPSALPNDHHRNPTPIPLFPLLPSVQILFGAFCWALIERWKRLGRHSILTPIGRHTDKCRYIWLRHLDPEDQDDERPESRRVPTG